jgi:hypothetical protein
LIERCPQSKLHHPASHLKGGGLLPPHNRVADSVIWRESCDGRPLFNHGPCDDRGPGDENDFSCMATQRINLRLGARSLDDDESPVLMSKSASYVGVRRLEWTMTYSIPLPWESEMITRFRSYVNDPDSDEFYADRARSVRESTNFIPRNGRPRDLPNMWMARSVMMRRPWTWRSRSNWDDDCAAWAATSTSASASTDASTDASRAGRIADAAAAAATHAPTSTAAGTRPPSRRPHNDYRSCLRPAVRARAPDEVFLIRSVDNLPRYASSSYNHVIWRKSIVPNDTDRPGPHGSFFRSIHSQCTCIVTIIV